MDDAALAQQIKAWGAELGFQAVGIADADLSAAEPRLLEWLAQGWHGEMEYMARHGTLRARPQELQPGTLRVISCRMDYLQGETEEDDPQRAQIARYARGLRSYLEEYGSMSDLRVTLEAGDRVEVLQLQPV